MDQEAVSTRRVLNVAQDAALGFLRWTTDRTKEPRRVWQGQAQVVKTMASMISVWPEVASHNFARSATIAAKLAQEDPLTASFRKRLAGWAVSPGFGLRREYQAKFGRALNAWIEYQQADVAYRRVMSHAWAQSVATVMQTYADKAKAGDPPKTAKEAFSLWIDVADRTFIEIFRTDEYSRAQASLLNASMAFRSIRRELVDDALASSDLPTRRELDEAHRMIYTLRKELKAVKRQINAWTEEEQEDG